MSAAGFSACLPVMSNEVETSTTNGQPDQQAAPKAPSKKEKKKGSEKTDEYLLARFKGDGVKYKAKLIGIDDVPDASGGHKEEKWVYIDRGLHIELGRAVDILG